MIRRNGKFLSVMLSVCMAAGSVPAVFAQDGAAAESGSGTSVYSASYAGTDIDGHWAQKAMEEFIESGYINGVGNNSYAPDGTMTRAQYAAIVNRILKYTEESSDISKYKDVSSSAWYRGDMAKALAAAYMTGTSADTMSPEASVTREQAFVILARILKLEDADLSVLSAFKDAGEISDWAQGSVAALVKAGYVSGDNNGNINPKKAMTRAEGVTILNRSKEALDAHKVITKGVYADGVYVGTGAGYGGTMKLQVTIKDGKISDIKILSESETGSYLQRAMSLLQKIMDNNGTSGVNAISGATRTSNGIFDAVNACLSQAEGGADTSTTGSTGGGHGGSGNASKPSDDDAVGRWADGVYTGTAQGYSAAGVTAQVTVENGVITSITLTNNGETSSYYVRATGNTKSGTTIIDQIMSSQSTNNIDTVSGATRTSYGIINAVKAALKQASDAVTESYTFEVSDWAEFTRAVDMAADGDIIQLTGDITDAGEDWTAVSDETEALGESGGEGSGTSEKTFIDAITSATYGEQILSKNLTIDGQNHKITNSDDPEKLVFTFNISGNVTMKDLTVDGASYGNKMGGGIYVSGKKGSSGGASLTMNNVTVKNCRSYKTSMPGNGGAGVWIKSGSLTAENCVFEGNEIVTQGRGGAVMISGISTATLTNCEFKNNSAKYGGAIAAYGTSTLTVKDSTFSGNDGEYGGNDIYIFDGATQGKKGAYSDSNVSYTLTGNTYGTYKIAEGDDAYKNYAVMLGRYYTSITTEKDGQTVTKNYVGSGADSVFAPGYDVTFKDEDRTIVDKENTTGNTAEKYTYMLVNIPYDKFYEAELGGNTVSVDAVTSATKEKTRANDLAGGSYHVSKDGSDITGVIYPVLVKNEDVSKLNALGGSIVDDDTLVQITTTLRGDTSTKDYKGSKALFEQKSYSYYITNETPAYYKVLTFNEDGKPEFSKSKGSVTTLSGIDAAFSADTHWGDYELDFVGITQFDRNEDDIYGTIIKTTDGTGYGLRHVENIWRGTDLGWCTGFTTSVKNSPTSSAHYVSMMGKTINEVVYYTSKGIFSIPLDDIYVPVKFVNEFSISDCDEGKSTVITASGFDVLEGFEAEYTVTDSDGADVTEKYGFSVNGNTLSWTGAPLAGKYTVEISDVNGKYAAVSADFVISSDAAAVVYDAEKKSLVKAEGISDDEFSNYLKNINTVSVKADGENKATDYSASGKGATVIVDTETGAFDLAAQSKNKNIFEPGKSYEVTVASTGYRTPLQFSVSVSRYITMNVPYTDFYKAYDLTDAAVWEVEPGVDAVSTATTTKFKGTTGLALGTYNDGTYIMGVTLSVEVSPEDFAKLNTGLGENDSYYFAEMDAVPSASTKLTVNEDGSYSFGIMSDADKEYANELSVTKDTLTLLDGYGDYQIDITGYKTDGMSIGGNRAVLYGAILKTDKEKTYGMTCLENNWVGTKVQNVQIAWSVKEGQQLRRAHGSGDLFYQFEDMNGATLTGVTLIMSAGLIELDCSVELPVYYTGDLSALTYAISSDSDELSISGIPEELEDVTITLSYKDGRNVKYIAEDVEINDGKVKLNAVPKDGVSYTLTINSSNFPGISRTVSTTISETQMAELERWMIKARATEGYDSNADLKEHVAEAAEMIEEGSASSADAATLIEELTEKVKKTYQQLSLSASLVGDNLTIVLPEGVELNSLENVEYTFTSGSGKAQKTLASGKLESLDITLSSVPEEGTECTLSIVCDNYKDSSCKVTAEAAKSAELTLSDVSGDEEDGEADYIISEE